MSSLPMQMSQEQCSSLLESNLSFSDVVDRVVAMKHQESTHYRSRDYIRTAEQYISFSHQEDRVVDSECRAKMAEWCYQVTDYCKFSRQTVAIGMSYLDRFMSTHHPAAAKALCSKKHYQLAAMTCLYIAIKMFEPIAFDTALLSDISHGCYDEEDIEVMERNILQGLSWRMNGPTAHDMLHHLLMLLPDEASVDDSIASVLLDFSRFQAEIAVSDFSLAIQKPSIVALAAILNSSEGISKQLFPAHLRKEYLENITDLVGIDSFSAKLNAVRMRLLALFEINSGYRLHQIANITPVFELEHVYLSEFPDDTVGSTSPVSVAITRARCA
ncbi:hypothetical protein ACHAXN_009109 [Cyclotella atomus]